MVFFWQVEMACHVDVIVGVPGLVYDPDCPLDHFPVFSMSPYLEIPSARSHSGRWHRNTVWMSL